MASYSWENSLKSSIKVGLITAVIMPLILVKEHIFPLIVQLFFFQATVLIVLGLFFALIVFSRHSYFFKLTPITLGLLIFMGSFFMSALFAVDWHVSLWGSPYFMKGVVFMLFGFTYYLIMSQVFSGWNDWSLLLRFVAGVGAAVVFLGIVFSEGGLCQLASLRMGSVLGNPVFLGGYSMMVFFLGLLGLAMERSFPFRIFFVACSSLSFLGVLLSGTRSAILGLAAGLIILALWYGFKLIKERKLYDEVRWMVVLFATVIFVLGSWQIICDLSGEKEAATTAGITRILSANIENRAVVWQGAIEAWPEKPFFGWGPNNFDYAFNVHYQPKSFLYGETITWPDGVWNVWLEALVERGIFGLFALFFLLVVIIWSLFIGYKRGRLPFFGLAIGTAFIFAYFIHLSFIFELASMTMLFFLFLAFVNSMTISKTDQGLSLSVPDIRKKPFLVMGTLIILLFIILVFVGLLPEAANRVMYSAVILLQDDPNRAMEVYDKVVKNIPTPYLSELQASFFMSGLPHFDKWEKEQVNQFAQLGIISLQAEVNKGKPKIIPLLNQAEIARQAAYTLNNNYLLKDAERFLEEARSLSPKRQQTIFLLATVKMELGDFEKAYQLVKEGIEITPTAPQGWLRLIWIHKMNDDEESARKAFQEAQDRDITFKLKDVEKVNQILSPECCNRGEIF